MLILHIPFDRNNICLTFLTLFKFTTFIDLLCRRVVNGLTNSINPWYKIIKTVTVP